MSRQPSATATHRWEPRRDDGRGVGPRARPASGWPLALGLVGYPLAWLLGLRLVWWPFVAVLLVVGLARRPRAWGLRVPRGSGWWALFLAWTLVSALTLSGAGRVAAWGYREAYYLAATVVLLACVNLTERELPTRRIAAWLFGLFTSTVVLGTLGILLPDVSLPTLGEALLPASVEHIPFVAEQTSARLGATAAFIGAVRPSAPFGYTNEWGAALGVLWPLGVYATSWTRTRRARIGCWTLLAFSLVPVVISVNRGLWVSIAVAVAVVGLRSLVAARVRTVLAVGGLTLAGLLVGWLSPLRGVVEGRLAHPNLGTRQTLVGDALALVRTSPLYGFGAPQAGQPGADTNDVSIGTHGQLWTLLVSHGVPGAAFYVGFFVAALVLPRWVTGPAVWAWAAVLVTLVQLLFYNSVPVPLVLGMIGVALCLRHTSGTAAAPPDAAPTAGSLRATGR